MVTQTNSHRIGGSRFAAKNEAKFTESRAFQGISARIAACAAKSCVQTETQAAPHVRENRNSVENTHAQDLEDWKIERLDHEISSPTHATSSLSSYKAQKCQNSEAKNPAEYPMAKHQNPTNNQEVALLLEKYGDIRGVMKDYPFFKRIQKPIEEGGWGTELAGLIYLAKTYTLERVLWAAKAAKNYQGARDKGSIFNHAVRKGLEAGK